MFEGLFVKGELARVVLSLFVFFIRITDVISLEVNDFDAVIGHKEHVDDTLHHNVVVRRIIAKDILCRQEQRERELSAHTVRSDTTELLPDVALEEMQQFVFVDALCFIRGDELFRDHAADFRLNGQIAVVCAFQAGLRAERVVGILHERVRGGAAFGGGEALFLCEVRAVDGDLPLAGGQIRRGELCGHFHGILILVGE